MRGLQRRTFLEIVALGGGAVGCAPEDQGGGRAPGPAPAREPGGGTPPGETGADSRAAQGAQAPPESPDAGWEADWARLVAAATAEGALSLITMVGRGYQRVIESFERAFPAVRVDHLAESSPGVWLAAAERGRRAGSLAFDLALAPPERALAAGRAAGLWAPVRPLLMRPDVLDDGAWRDDLNARFLDAEASLCFGWEYQVVHAYAVNTDLVREGEIGTVQDLLDARWRGRVLSSDPRAGTALLSAASVARRAGADVLRRLLVDQRPALSREAGRSVTEPLVRGRYPVALGVRPKALQEFRDQGLGHKVRFLDLPDADFAATLGLLHFDRAPHPAAAALFANWALTAEGQRLLASSLPTNSARSDVPGFEPDGIGAQGTRYYEPDREANFAHTAATERLVRGLLESAR